MKTKLKNTVEKCECHNYCLRPRKCSHCNPEKQSKRTLEETLETVGKIQEKIEKQGDDWEEKFWKDAENIFFGFTIGIDGGDEYNSYLSEADTETRTYINNFIRQVIKQAEQRERERVIEEVKEHIRNWDYRKVDNLYKWIDQLKQKTKE